MTTPKRADDDLVPVPQRDIDRLSREGYYAWTLLAGLRDGTTINELGRALAAVVNAVQDMTDETETGKVIGPTGTVTLQITVAPNEVNPNGFVKLSEKIAMKKPEDRSHVVYLGRGGTVHTRDPRAPRLPQLFAVDPVTKRAEPEPDAPADGTPGEATPTSSTPDTAPGVQFSSADTDAPGPGTGGGTEDPTDGERRPYKDD